MKHPFSQSHFKTSMASLDLDQLKAATQALQKTLKAHGTPAVAAGVQAAQKLPKEVLAGLAKAAGMKVPAKFDLPDIDRWTSAAQAGWKAAQSHAAARPPTPDTAPSAQSTQSTQSTTGPVDEKHADPAAGGPAAVDAFLSGAQAFPGAKAAPCRLYVPPAIVSGQPLPLVVMLHGCTQNPADFAAGTGMNAIARREGFLVLYPEQTSAANPQHCWNWFRPDHQKRGAGEPAQIAELVELTRRHFTVDANRIFVAGLSAGGAMAALVARAYPEVFAAAGVHSGLASGAARDVVSALKVMRTGEAARETSSSTVLPPPMIVFHGDADATVHPDHAAHLVDSALPFRKAAGRPASEDTTHTTAGGVRSTRRIYRLGADGPAQVESWTRHGGGHAWSGGSAAGSYTDPAGPNASAEMWRFFAEHSLQVRS